MPHAACLPWALTPLCAAASCQLRGAVSNIVAQSPGQNGDSVFAGTTMAGDVYEIRVDYKARPGPWSNLTGALWLNNQADQRAREPAVQELLHALRQGAKSRSSP